MIINFLRHSFSCCDKYTHREAIFMWAVYRLDIVNSVFLGRFSQSLNLLMTKKCFYTQLNVKNIKNILFK